MFDFARSLFLQEPTLSKTQIASHAIKVAPATQITIIIIILKKYLSQQDIETTLCISTA